MTVRGSAPYFNEILREAVARGKELVDATTKVLTQSGYPPLTEPVSLSMLKKMPPEAAVETLRQELARTTKVDPLTNEPIPDSKTMRLVVDYLESQRGPA